MIIMKPINEAWGILKASEEWGDVTDAVNAKWDAKQQQLKDSIEEQNNNAREALNAHHSQIEALEEFKRRQQKKASEEMQAYLRRYEKDPQGEEEPKISNIMDDGQSVIDNNPHATNLVSPTGRLPGQEPPPQEQNPLGLSMDKLKELKGGQ